MIKKLFRAMTGAVALLFYPKNCPQCSGTGKILCMGAREVDCGCEASKTEHIPDNDAPVLGGCYHNGTAWSLGYETAHGEVELDGKTFTNLDTGLDGGVMAALRDHRKNYDPARDVPRLMVELKVVKVIRGVEPYKLDNGSPEKKKDTRCAWCKCVEDEDDSVYFRRCDCGNTLCEYCVYSHGCCRADCEACIDNDCVCQHCT